MKNPAIVHFALCYPKTWKRIQKGRYNSNCLPYYEKWYLFAMKTDYYKEISEAYNE